MNGDTCCEIRDPAKIPSASVRWGMAGFRHVRWEIDHLKTATNSFGKVYFLKNVDFLRKMDFREVVAKSPELP